MNDSADLPLPPTETPSDQPRKGRTGPTSPNGKARSSENAITHGCRSQKLILRHEDPAEFEALRDAWFRHYQPQTEIGSALVEELVRAHWLFKRAQKHLEDIEWELPANAYHWTEEHERLFRNFTRYKTSYERTFLRFFKELETHFNRNAPAGKMKERAFAIAAKLQEECPAEEQQVTPDLEYECAQEPLIGSQTSGQLPTPRCRT